MSHQCEMFEGIGENTWGNKLLRLTMNNTMIQWVTDHTRFREHIIIKIRPIIYQNNRSAKMY